MPQGLTVKNVEKALKKAHKCRRRQGEVPYPVAYNKEMADFDMWDHMFLTNHFQGLTQHKFDTPPLLVLDLGCGTGFWAIEAAKQWQNSTIVGYDICELQPRFDGVEHLQSVSRRVKWVKGNFLDGLPFPSNHFDFVRMAGLGLAIPEDEWQSVLEEINRVMKPAAVLEIIVEDLIFPTPSALLQKSEQHNLEPLELFKTRSPPFSDASPISSMSSLSSLIDPLTRRNRSSIFQPSSPLSEYPSSSSSVSRPLPSSTGSVEREHPQDHTRFKHSWDAMLSTRFLSPKVVSIIPFYLTSCFADTKSFPPLVIPLPPNSGNLPSLKSYQSLGSFQRDRTRSNTFFDLDFDFDLAPLSNRSSKADGFSFRSSIRYKPQPPTWSPVHMTKTLCTVRSCREAIWKEYEKLYRDRALEILLSTALPGEKYDETPPEYLAIIAFEVDWQNWEYDMLDRTGMRDHLSVHVPWVQAATEDEYPPHTKWRKNLDPGPDCEHLVAAYNPSDVCRSLRVFTAFKSS